MTDIAEVYRPQSEDSYKRVHVQLATTYDMSQFEDDLKKPKDPNDPVYGFHVYGKCPRCGHPSSCLVPVKYLTSSPPDEMPMFEPTADACTRVEKERLTALHDQDVLYEPSEMKRLELEDGFDRYAAVLACHCQVTHDPTSSNTGCGAEWMIAFAYSRSGHSITLSPVPAETAARIWVAADAVSASVATAGKTAMGLAAKWVATLSAVVGIITIAGIIGGRDTIQSLCVWAQVAIGLATLAALTANAFMIYQGNIAGTGYPALKNALKERALIDADIQPLRDAEACITRLGSARTWAIATGIATLVAVGLFLFVPPAGTDHAKVKYTENGVAYQSGCGKLTTDKSNNPTSFKPDHGAEVVFTGATNVEVDAC